MAKRFTDTDIWDKVWFMELSVKMKCAVRYLFDRCDIIGLWEPNYVIMKTYIGELVTEQEILSVDGGRQFELLENGRIFIRDFCDFQYGELTEDCKPHRPIIKKLKKLGLYGDISKGYPKGINTLEEKEKEKDIYLEKEKENTEKGSGEKPKHKKLEVENPQKELKTEYSEIIAEITDKPNDLRWETLKNFIAKKPQFAEPYVDTWNLFAINYGLINGGIRVTESRKSKIRTRVREPSFDFIEILKKITKSAFLKGDNDRGWKVDFDFIMENDSNYIKILEEKYK